MHTETPLADRLKVTKDGHWSQWIENTRRSVWARQYTRLWFIHRLMAYVMETHTARVLWNSLPVVNQRNWLKTNHCIYRPNWQSMCPVSNSSLCSSKCNTMLSIHQLLAHLFHTDSALSTLVSGLL